MKGIFAELARDGISEDELTAAKNKILSALVIRNELPMGRLAHLGADWVYRKDYKTVEDDINAVKAVNVDDVVSLIEQFDLAGFTQLSIGPPGAK